jgi:hypothetical protein
VRRPSKNARRRLERAAAGDERVAVGRRGERALDAPRASRSGRADASIASAASYRTGGRHRAHTNASVGMHARHRRSSRPRREARSSSSAIDDRQRLVRAVDRDSLATSSALEPRRPAAHTRIIGSDDRSMCFLSSVTSQAIDL